MNNIIVIDEYKTNKLIKIWYIASIIYAIIEGVISSLILLWILTDNDIKDMRIMLVSATILTVFTFIICIYWFYKKNKLFSIIACLAVLISFFEWFLFNEVEYFNLFFSIPFLIWTIGVFKYNKKHKVKFWKVDIFLLSWFIISLILNLVFIF